MKKTKAKKALKKHSSKLTVRFKTKKLSILSVIVVVGFVGAFGIGIYKNRSLSDTDINTSAAPGIPTISTNYSVPAPASGKVVRYVGTNETYKTLQSAISAAQAGDVIVVKAKADGSPYREGKLSLTKNIKIVGNPGDQVWFDGSLDVTNGNGADQWAKKANGKYELKWYTPDFCSNATVGHEMYNKYYDATGNDLSTKSHGVPIKDTMPCAHEDMSLDPNNPMAWDPQAVYLNSLTGLKQVVSESGVTDDNKFYYHRSGQNSKIVINFAPSATNKVEITKFPSFMLTHTPSADGVQIKGLGFRKYATSEGEKGNYNGVFYVNSKNAVFDNLAIWKNSGSGMRVTNSSSEVTIKNSIFKENGYNALNANKSPNIVFEKNIVEQNNNEGFGKNCAASCGHAGVKMAHMIGGDIRYNLFVNNNGHGYWCDEACDGTKIYGNYAKGNSGSGIFYEVSKNGIIASNLLTGNLGPALRSCSANTRIYNNTAVNNNRFLEIYEDQRTGTNISDINSTTGGMQIANNIFSGAKNNPMVEVRLNGVPENVFFKNNNFNHNSYNKYGYDSNSIPTTLISWKGSATQNYTNLASFKSAKIYETNGFENTNAQSNPFFVNFAGGDYRTSIPDDASEYGQILPSDIAALLNVPANTQTGRGALKWVDQNMNIVTSPVTSQGNNNPPTAPGSFTATNITANSARLTWGASTDPDGNAITYTIKQGSTVIASNLSSATLAHNLTGLTPSSSNTYTIQAIDSNGAASTAASTTFITLASSGDTTLPNVSITSPTGGSTLTGVTSLAVNASDNQQLASIDFYIFGNPNAIARITNFTGIDTTVNRQYQVNWNSSAAQNGGRLVYAIATDAAGNIKQSSNVSVTVSNTTLKSFNLDGDPENKVNIIDLSKLLSDWGKTGILPTDINNDNKVNIIDLSLLLNNWTD